MLVRMWGGEGKGPLYTVGGNVSSAGTMQISTEVPLKIKNRPSGVDPATPLLGIYPKDTIEITRIHPQVQYSQ
jgi:hypothetical protein